MNDDLVIVGGGPAAKAAAWAYRDAGGEGAVTILAAEPRPPYERPALTKGLLRGEQDAVSLELEDHDWYEALRIEVELKAKVEEIDLAGRQVIDDHGRVRPYADCLLATGARPLLPEVAGLGHERVHTIRTADDSIALAGAIGQDTRVVVVGSGYIGCEAAASLAMRGAQVSIATLEARPQLARLGDPGAELIESWLAEHGIAIEAEANLLALEHHEKSSIVRLEDSRELDADIVVLALGIERNVELARSCGLEVGAGIQVDSSMRTSDPHVYAAGDAALAFNPTAWRSILVEHWGEALAQGEVAGRSMAGEEASWDTVPGFWSQIGERTLKYAGWMDGFDSCDASRDGESLVVRYERGGELVGLLAYEDDATYEAGKKLIRAHAAPAGR